MLARAVDAGERLLVLQAHQAVVAGQKAHLLHGEQVLVDGAVGVGEDGGQLVLGGGHLVVLRLGRHAQLPQLVVELLHELVHRGADGAEVVLFQLLALAGRIAEQRAAAHDEVLALGVVLFRDQEIFLLGTHRGNDALVRLSEQREHAVRLLFHHVHGAEERRLLVERLAGVAAEGGGDAQHLVLDERVGRGIPGGVAAGLEGGAQAARREAGRVGLALDELLAGEAHDGAAVPARVEEAVVLLRRDAGERLEPVRVVRGALLDGPFLHGVRHHVGHLYVEGLALLDGSEQALVRRGRESFLHRVLVEHHGTVDVRHFRHRWLLLTVRRAVSLPVTLLFLVPQGIGLMFRFVFDEENLCYKAAPDMPRSVSSM